VLGQWLRAQPIIVKAGTVLLTHGGIGPQVVRAGLTVDVLNDAMRRYWTQPSPALDAVLGPAGGTQYRGYCEPGEERYAKAGATEVEHVRRHLGASTADVERASTQRMPAAAN
jgi:hypothetical protein